MSQGYLVDTSVISTLAPGRPALAPEIAAWLRDHTQQLFLSAITIAEIEQGIRKLRRAGGAQRADRFSHWLDELLAAAGDRVLALDSAIARRAGALSDQALAAGRHPGFPDIAIAATALVHDLVLLTSNGRHFEPLGVIVADPFIALPGGRA